MAIQIRRPSLYRMGEGRIDGDIQTMIDELNQSGAEGWELLTVVPPSYNPLDELLRPVRKILFYCYWKQPVEAGVVK